MTQDGTQQDHTLLDVGAYDPGVQSLMVRSLGPFPSFRRLSDGHRIWRILLCSLMVVSVAKLLACRTLTR